MKFKHIILPLLLFVFITSSSAQDFFAGPLGGVSFCQVDGDSYAGFNKAGLILGGFVGRNIGENWEAQFEIMYIQKGSTKKPDVEAGDYTDYSIHLEYIHFPLIARYNLKKFSFEGGISYGALINSVEKDQGELIPEENAVPFLNSEWATIFGFNYQITDRLKVNTRITYSLFRVRIPFNGDLPVYNPHPTRWRKKPGQYNDVITVSLYYNLFQER